MTSSASLRTIRDFPPKNTLPSKKAGSDSLNSSIATKVDSFSTPYISSKCTGTPNLYEETPSNRLLTPTNEVLEMITSKGQHIGRAQHHAKMQRWNQAMEELHRMEPGSLRDMRYEEVAQIAAQIAAQEIQSNSKPYFHSPTTIKAYHFASEIADPVIRKQALDYINVTLPEEDIEPEESVTAETSDILQDFQYWDLAEEAAFNHQWESAYKHLDNIQDVFWKNSADGELKKIQDSQSKDRAIKAAIANDWGAAREHLDKIKSNLYRDAANNVLTKLAANAAIDVAHNKPLYYTAVLRANGFCQDITDDQYQANTGIVLREMLKQKTKASLSDISKFGNEWILQAQSQHVRSTPLHRK